VNIPILDCHQHLMYTDRMSYSWTSGIPQLSGQAFTYQDYLQKVRDKGEVRTIFMETSPDDEHRLEESRFVADLADQPGSIIDGLVVGCRPESQDTDAFIDAVRHDKLVGVRRILHVMPDELSQQPVFIKNVRKLSKYNLNFDLCVLARQLPIGTSLVRQCPEVQFVLDHCGVPNISGGELDPWRDDLKALAACDNVACKISGLLAYCDPDDVSVDAVRPFVEHAIECFGWDRVVWGGDWPVVNTTSDLPTWIDVSRELVAGESEDNQRKLFATNAHRIYLKQGL